MRVLAGANDPLASSPGTQALAERLNGSFRPLADTDHSIPAEAPERSLEEITRFWGIEA